MHCQSSVSLRFVYPPLSWRTLSGFLLGTSNFVCSNGTITLLTNPALFSVKAILKMTLPLMKAPREKLGCACPHLKPYTSKSPNPADLSLNHFSKSPSSPYPSKHTPVQARAHCWICCHSWPGFPPQPWPLPSTLHKAARMWPICSPATGASYLWECSRFRNVMQYTHHTWCNTPAGSEVALHIPTH